MFLPPGFPFARPIRLAGLLAAALATCWLPSQGPVAELLAGEGPVPRVDSVEKLERFSATDRIMGMDFNLTFYCRDEKTANRAAQAVFERIKELNGVFSDYEPESELRKLSATAGSGEFVPVSDDFWTVLLASREITRRSEGTFDLTVGPMVKLWRKSRRSRTLPTSQELASAKELVGDRLVEVQAASQSVRLNRKGMQLDAGGIAVGYAVDEGLKVFREQGVTSALIDGSGDIGVSNPPPGEAAWRISVAPLRPNDPPSETVLLSNAAVTTSGDAFQYVEINGVRYAHIMDITTGLGLTRHSAVTVVAPKTIDADAYAKAVYVLGPEKGVRLADETPGMACLFVLAADPANGQGEARVVRSARWDAYCKAPGRTIADGPKDKN